MKEQSGGSASIILEASAHLRPSDQRRNRRRLLRFHHFLLSLFFFSIGGSDEWRLSFSVYQPDSVADFRKSSPGKPYARVCVCRWVMSHCVGSEPLSLSSRHLTLSAEHSHHKAAGLFLQTYNLMVLFKELPSAWMLCLCAVAELDLDLDLDLAASTAPSPTCEPSSC